jgi:hypothetical protein
LPPIEGFCMRLYSRFISLATIFLLALSTSACSDKSQSNIKQSATSVKETREKAIKPGAAIKLISPSIIYINPGEKSSTEILLETKESFGELDIEISAPVELELLDTSLKTTINLPSNAIKIPISLLASANGRFYLKVLARINAADRDSFRNLSLIVQVGPEPVKTLQLKKTSDENIISLPAQETISSQ